jgi:hypothetical protein
MRRRTHFGRIREVMNPGEQFIQLARRGNTEQGVHRFIADVLVAVRNYPSASGQVHLWPDHADARARVFDQLDGLRMARGGAILDDVLPDRGAQAAAWPALITPPSLLVGVSTVLM